MVKKKSPEPRYFLILACSQRKRPDIPKGRAENACSENLHEMTPILRKFPVLSLATLGEQLMKFAGILRTEEAEHKMRAIEQDCRRVALNEW